MTSKRRSFGSLFEKFSSRRTHTSARRRLKLEALENRTLLTADLVGGALQTSAWLNTHCPADVNNDGYVSPVDALVIINSLNTEGVRDLRVSKAGVGEGESQGIAYYYDVNNDGYLSPIDALNVINRLNGEGEPIIDPAPNALGAVSGYVYNDLAGDGSVGGVPSVDNPALSGVSVQLWVDDGDGIPDIGDTFAGQTTSDAGGYYSFEGLAAGTYFVKQLPAGGGLVQLPGEDTLTVVVTPEEAAGTGTTIDDFETGQTLDVMSDSQFTVDADYDDTATSAIGGERELYVLMLSQFGDVALTVSVTNGYLEFNSAGFGEGVRLVNWDGTADGGDAMSLDTTGLGGIDLTDGGNQLFIYIEMGAGLAGTVTMQIYSDDLHASEYTVDIPLTDSSDPDSDTVPVLFPMSDFTVISGMSGAVDFTSVGAIQLSITGTAGLDGQIDLVGTKGYSYHEDVNFRNLQQMELGDQVWFDTDNNGQLDAGESGVNGVKVNVYEDTDGNGVYTSGTDLFVATTTTATEGMNDGIYSFTVLPGSYIVQVDPVNFTAGHPLEGWSASTINTPDPNDDVNGDNNGMPTASNGVVAGAVTMIAGTEPDDGGLANYTVDFGFYQLTEYIDLTVTKVDSADPVNLGDSLTYTIVVTNNGTATAQSVTMVDVLPLEAAYVSATTSQGTIGPVGGNVEASLGSLDPSASATITITVNVATLAPENDALMLNVVTVADPEEPENFLNNNSDTEETVIRTTDLQIVKTDLPDPVVAGQTLTYTLTVTNNGPFADTNVQVSDVVPSVLTVTSVVASQGTASHAGGTVSGNLGALAVGASATITVQATVAPTASGQIDNTATVTGDLYDTNMENNQDTEPTNIIQQVDLAVTKTDSVDPVHTGGRFTYTIVVTNNGPSTATGIVVTDTLPAEVTYFSSTNPAGTISESGGVVTATLASLAPGASATLTVTVDVQLGFIGTLNNTVVVSTTAQNDTNPDNNTDTEPTEVIDVPPEPSSIEGIVFVDLDNDGIYEPGGNEDGLIEFPVHSVIITLTGTSYDGQTVEMTTLTDANGHYGFYDLLPGTYTVRETQPNPLLDGIDTPGSPLACDLLDDVFADMVISNPLSATEYNFAEQLPSKREYLASTNPYQDQLDQVYPDGDWPFPGGH